MILPEMDSALVYYWEKLSGTNCRLLTSYGDLHGKLQH